MAIMVKNYSKPGLSLSLAALGVVFGDIGTSPLYTLQACFDGIHVDTANVLGIISLIFWSLILVVSTCYLSIFLNASNDGEGGVLALLGLFDNKQKSYRWLFLIGIFGAGLLISDGMLTPAISVLSAMEGLKVISPQFSHWVLPLTLLILITLFSCQRYGTQTIGRLFGPILLIWFSVIGLIGLWQIINHPHILWALNPYYAVHFLYENGFRGFILLGSVFLAITGAEAMYADLGQFGKAPIRLSWFCVVLPGLMLSFFGQGAHLLATPSAVDNPFYHSAPGWFGLPLLLLAAMATIIASQAIISASYSLAKQGMLLSVMPRLKVVQTSSEQTGQIYVPLINLFFAIGSIGLVVFFESSLKLTNAYGIAINIEMLIMALLVTYLAYQHWQWSLGKILRVFTLFIVIDLAFLASNFFKIIDGGWIPLVFAFLCLMVMLSWHKGINLLHLLHAKKKRKHAQKTPLASAPHQQQFQKLASLEAVFITNTYDKNGEGFFRYFETLQACPKQWLIVTIKVEPSPFINDKARFSLTPTEHDMKILTLHFGFKEIIDIPLYLKQANKKKLLPCLLSLDSALYFIENIAITPSQHKTPNFNKWQKRLFMFMFENTVSTFSSLDFLKLPRDRTVIIGTYVEL